MMTRNTPTIGEAPGLHWKPRANGWEARWECRPDIARKGYEPKSVRLWAGDEPNDIEKMMISDACKRLQAEMLIFNNPGAIPQLDEDIYAGTIRWLVNAYQTDPDSSYRKLRYHVRVNHDSMLRRIVERHGAENIADIKARGLLAWHKVWSHDGTKLATGHLFVAQLRTLFKFGKSFLEDAECARVSGILSDLRFSMPKAREEWLTAEQADAIRARAHYIGNHSIAMAQALQFECTMRQKDIIGEWIPLSEPGTSDIAHPKLGKWFRGLRWEEIDASGILRHTTSKKEKPVVVDLKLAPMVLSEFQFYYPGSVIVTIRDGKQHIAIDRSILPDSGPVILSEYNALPYKASEFRRKWRAIADAAGVPKTVWNMDTRSGAISEATDAGAELELVRHAATHSQVSMTARYSRSSEKKVAQVMRIRSGSRGKTDSERD